jgi:hypothetical protein
MRAAVAIPLLLMMTLPNCGRSDSSDPKSFVAPDRRAASWSEWEAEARMADGDYEGAVQAEQRAAAEMQEMAARAPKRLSN